MKEHSVALDHASLDNEQLCKQMSSSARLRLLSRYSGKRKPSHARFPTNDADPHPGQHDWTTTTNGEDAPFKRLN